MIRNLHESVLQWQRNKLIAREGVTPHQYLHWLAVAPRVSAIDQRFLLRAVSDNLWGISPIFSEKSINFRL